MNFHGGFTIEDILELMKEDKKNKKSKIKINYYLKDC